MIIVICVLIGVIAALVFGIIGMLVNQKGLEEELAYVEGDRDCSYMVAAWEHNIVERVYGVLITTLNDKKVTKADMAEAMQESIGYLGEILDDHREDEDDNA